MKRVMMMAMLCLPFLCLAAGAQTGKQENSEAKDLLIKTQVDTAVSMLQAIDAKRQRGEMTLEKAKELGAYLLRELKYGTDGYFWADTAEGVNVVLYGRKDVEGRNRIEDKDSKGTFYVKEFLEKSKTGGGYVDYLFVKKGQTVDQSKRAYVSLFEPFGWIVGTGYYR